MRWLACLLTILLGGCHSVSVLERPTAQTPPSIMPLWERYQECLVTTDPSAFASIIHQLEGVMLVGAEAPAWMRRWGPHVATQPIRTSVDPQALGVACTLRAAAVMAEAKHLTEARALYQRVLARYPHREWAYYVDQAKEGLAGLQDSLPTIIALRFNRPLSR